MNQWQKLNYLVISIINIEMFIYDTINFQLNMTEFKESVFLQPLQSNRLTINLNPSNSGQFDWFPHYYFIVMEFLKFVASRFMCGCNISWLIRDDPALLFQVNNGTCSDGRPFQSVPVEEVSCCRLKHVFQNIQLWINFMLRLFVVISLGPTDSLIRRLHLLQQENDNLKAEQSKMRSFVSY